MKFSRKIFLAIFATSTAAVVLVCGSLYVATSSYRLNDLKSSYEDHMQLLGMALARVEESQGRLALSAAHAVLEIDHDHQGPWTGTELQNLAQAHGVQQISIFNQKGDLVASSGKASANIFATCGNLQKLLQDPTAVSQTPLLPHSATDSEDGISQYTRIASADHKHLVEVRVQFSAVTHLLGELAQHDEDNEYIELMGPSNVSLGQLHRANLPDDPNLKQNANKADGSYLENNRLLVVSSVKTPAQNCCECQQVGSAGSSYRLITSISTRTYDQEVRRLASLLIAISLVLILFSFWLSAYLTRLLLRKIDVIRSVVAEITQSQNYSKRVDLPASGDELDELGNHFNQMFSTLQSQQEKMLEAERDKARSQVAAQVAHDIRSPLMSMNMALNQIQSPQAEALAILKSAVQRVAGIVQKLTASTLKQENTPAVEAPKLTLLEPLIMSVVNEHRVKNPATQAIQVEGLSLIPSLWVVLQVIEFQTALSNLLNNAFEAGASEVRLLLSTEGKNIFLKIVDNGQGIPAAVQDKIFERSFSSGKKNGNGLGLYQAKAAIEWSGGHLQVSSQEGQGTTFTIQLPQEKKPRWLPAVLEFRQEQSLFFVDDDAHILQLWKDKTQGLSVKAMHFLSSVAALETQQSLQSWPSDAVLFIDQNLLDSKNGLDVIAELAIGSRAYLCTSEFDEKSIQDRVQSLKAGLIPKPLLTSLEIKMRSL